MKRITLVAIAATAILIGTAAADGGDAKKGKRYFVQCKACHSLDKGRNGVGPSLHCIVGRPAGTAPKYSYSKGLKALAATGYKWDEAGLFEYLEYPRGFLKKKLATDNVRNKMVNRFRRKEFRRDVIAYLKAEACK